MMTKSKSSTRNIVARLVDTSIETSGKTASAIAAECGLPNASFISLIRCGKNKVPLAKIGILAQALGLDVLRFRNLVLQQYKPELWELDMQLGIMPLGLTLPEQKAVYLLKLGLEKHNLTPDEKFYEGLLKTISDLKTRTEVRESRA